MPIELFANINLTLSEVQVKLYRTINVIIQSIQSFGNDSFEACKEGGIRKSSRRVGEKGKSWEKSETLYCRKGERASFRQKVPRLHPFVLLIKAVSIGCLSRVHTCITSAYLYQDRPVKTEFCIKRVYQK
jgi:hypothetical protein